MDSFVFVHIPKSAGTSFRLGADQYFGERMVCSDYGPKTQETSEDVKDWIYKGNNFWGFTKAFREKGYRYLAGHFPAIEYALLFGVEHMITLMRDPVQLVISEYNHFDGIRLPFVRGMIGGVSHAAVVGQAVFDNTDEPVTIEVLIDGNLIGTAKAKDYRPHLCQIGVHRGGYVGFNLKVPRLKTENSIECRVAETGQSLIGSPRPVTEKDVGNKQISYDLQD